MPSPKKEPVGSTANLPPQDVIEAAEEMTDQDIDSVFGMSDEEEPASAAAGEEATASSAAGAAGAASVDGQAPAPAKSPEGADGTPPSPSGDAVPPQSATPADGTSAAPSGQQAPGTPAAQTPAPAAAPAAAAPVDPNVLKVNSLEATVQALTAELAQLRASPPATQPAGGQGASPQAPGQQDDLPRYALQLPPQVAAAINSGDEAQTVQGITHMMNSLATIVHHNVRLEMRQALGMLVNSAHEAQSQEQVVKAASDSREDYYKAFPAHKDPLILPIIQAESMAMAGEFPGLKWDDNYRNALGQRVEARLTQLRSGVQQQPNGGTPPQQPAAMLPSGARSEVPGSELTGGDLIMDTFS